MAILTKVLNRADCSQSDPFLRTLRKLMSSGLALVLLVVCSAAVNAQDNAQNQGGWSPGIVVTPGPADDGWATESRPAAPDAPAPSDAVERAREALATPDKRTGVMLSARLTEDGRILKGALTWRAYLAPRRAYLAPSDAEETPKLVATREQATPRLNLDPGTYFINVAFGRSHITKRVEVGTGPMSRETFVLNAGGLRLTAYASGKKLARKTVTYDVFEAETDQAGQRRLVISKAHPGVIVRLNAGIYFIRSTYGESNAQVESEVSVEAGKLTEIALAHAAAKITLALVSRAGGEALPATQWEIATPDGDVIDRSVGALPTHIIAPGTYRVTAANGGKVYSREVNLEDSQTARVELLAE